MNQSDESARNVGDEVPISEAEPYRTPVDVTDTPAARGMFQSPVAWIAAIGAVLAVGGVLALGTARTATQEFGESRMSVEAYEEYQQEMAAYEAEMAYEAEVEVSAPAQSEE